MAILNNEQIQLIQDFCDNYDYDFRDSYSGRGMMGRSCIGFVVDCNPFTLAIDLANYIRAEQGEDTEIMDIFTDVGVSSDSMGRQTIVYFQSITT